MIVVTEKREIVGTLKTLCGTYNLLDTDIKSMVSSQLYSFHAIDDEGFETWITTRGDFVLIPSSLKYKMDIKRIMTQEEAAQTNEFLTPATID